MKNRYRIYIRGKHSGGQVWWCQDNQTGKQESLNTKDKAVALRVLDLKNQPYENAGYHQQMARTHLQVADPDSITRTWQNVFESIIASKTGNTKSRWERVAKSKAFDPIRNLVVAETKAGSFLALLADCKISTNVFLRRLHNFALAANWLLAPIMAKQLWPKVKHGDKRPITLEEHQRIVERETNAERRAFYELCWHLGGSQSDIANLKAEDINWQSREVKFVRMKTHEVADIGFGADLEKVLRTLPDSGQLFPYLAKVRESDRATEFKQRCKGLGIPDVTLHCYRYSWARRARDCGYPERYAQQALGHASKAVHRAYAKGGEVQLPPLEDYEKTMKDRIIQLKAEAA